MRKKLLTLVMALAMVFAVAVPAGVASAVSDVTWQGQSDRDVAVNVDAVQNATRKNASGAKITSNAHSADFPGIYFIWDSKQKDDGYLKVDAGVFKDGYSSFVLTAKESNTYWDFTIALQPGQQKTADDCYVFFVPKVFDNKNINMVFVSEYNTTPVGQSYDRYLAYVELWNDFYTGKYGPDYVAGTYYGNILYNSGGIDHYYALLAYYGADSLPPYYHFDAGMKAVYDQWADALEPGLQQVADAAGVNLQDYVKNHPSNL